VSEAVKAALITGVLAIVAEVIIAAINSRVMMEKLDKQSQLADARIERAQAVTDTKLDGLTREVREHNNFAKRVPVVEEQIKVMNHRIQDLEQKTMRGQKKAHRPGVSIFH